MSEAPGWEFWIDVGGTFTDCVARSPDGSIRIHKLLSSGVYKGRVATGSTRWIVRAEDRTRDPARFFEGYSLTLLEVASDVRHAAPCASEVARVVRFDPDTGELALDRPLHAAPSPGIAYELSSNDEAPVAGIRWLLGRRLDETIGNVTVRLGTTRGTNALLERQGAATAFVTTRGFGDALRIAYQNRPKLFALHIRKPADIFQTVVELDERIDGYGRVLAPLDVERTRQSLLELKDAGIESLAVCLLNAYRNAVHEERVFEIACDLGFEQVSVSTQLAPIQRLVDRGDTTVVDAYLAPTIRQYVASIRKKLPHATIKLMTSAGSLTDAERFVGKDSILSGPAGGVVGAAYVGRQAGFGKVIGFDMGGTSTDVSRFDGEYERRYVMEVNDPESGAGVRIVAPMLSIETVAAGGGSICWFDGQKTCVGPRSAGSHPGPACYGRGGPLCITDVNLLLGRIVADQFAFPLDRAAAELRLREIAQKVAAATGKEICWEELAYGFVRVANAKMAAAIKKVSIARGHDIRDHALVSFGGAGAQHASALAAELGIQTIVQHPYAGVLSAFGIGIADVARFAVRHVGKPYSDGAGQLDPLFEELEADLRKQVEAEGIPAARILAGRRLLDLRYKGQDATIAVPRPSDGDYAAEFARRHRRRYGFNYTGRGIEIHAARLEVVGMSDRPAPTRFGSAEPRQKSPAKTRAYFAGRWHSTDIVARDQLAMGEVVVGPAIIAEAHCTIVVEPDWQAELTNRNELVLTATSGAKGQASSPAGSSPCGHEADPILLELFNNHFASIAEQMGVTLARTALSTNVKERLDFSCAVFSDRGALVVNAPHIPVHLGAMSETVQRLIADIGPMQPGDVYVTNDPYRGGSHLPDVTVVTPVFDAMGERILFFVGSRAHHAEIGGVCPGSMPPFSTCLAEEGVLIRSFRLVCGEQSNEAALRRILSSGPFPSRAVEDNIADINAQVAANQTGVALLGDLVAASGLETVQVYMRHIQRAAESKMRQALLRIAAGVYRFADTLDDGAVVSVTVTVKHSRHGGEAIVDFSGTGAVHRGNLNANPAIVRAAVMYCFRCLIDEDIPLNDGVLAPVRISIPANCLLNPPADDDPRRCAAIVGGNVETSQRVVDVILGALGVAAASQGTMNNFLFGRAATAFAPGFGYYETIGGGSGGGPGFDGASAVHTHMTNTRITDVEVLEARYPVRAKRFAIRRGSGGGGKYPGGDGIVREIEFLDALEVSLVTNRRTTEPFGLAGGGPGARGRNTFLRAGETTPQALCSAVQMQVRAGDILLLETPGGGGYGSA